MAYTYSKIATYTVGSGGVSSINFLNIPQNYTDLLIKFSGRGSGTSGVMRMQFNITTAGYSNRNLYGTGSAAGSESATGTSSFFSAVNSGNINWNSTTASTFSNMEIYIPNYTSSNYKSISTDAVVENNATLGYQFMNAGVLNITAPITQIDLLPSGSETFVQYSTAHLYGIKAEL